VEALEPAAAETEEQKIDSEPDEEEKGVEESALTQKLKKGKSIDGVVKFRESSDKLNIEDDMPKDIEPIKKEPEFPDNMSEHHHLVNEVIESKLKESVENIISTAKTFFLNEF